MNGHPVRGVIPAVFSPLTEDGKLDMQALETQMTYLAQAGVHGFYIGGTTAEGAYLSSEERREVLKLARSLTSGKITLYAVILRAHTEQVIEELNALLDLGPNYASAVTPYYYGVSQEAIRAHFQQIADASTIPLMLYNIPQNTHNPMSLETILHLAEHPNIVGVKDSSGMFIHFSRGMLETEKETFAWIQGEDLLDAPSFLYGAPGLVTGLGNVWIEPYVRMYEAAQEGRTADVQQEQRTINRLARIIDVAGGAVIPAIKMAASIVGRGNSRMRLVGDTLPEAIRPRIEEVLADVGLVEPTR